MSSTNRGSERAEDDFYSTPTWCTKAILAHLGPLDGKRILEPSAGRGAIVRELLRAGADNANLIRVEADRARADVLLHDAMPGAPEVFCADFLRLGPNFAEPAPVGAARRFDLVVMNPPFSVAQEHVERAISFLAPGGHCAALLRLAFCTGAKRAVFRQSHPFDMYPLASRPSFTAEALAWMTDDDLRAQAKPIKAKKGQPERLETIEEVRARLRGTDSADYAWFVFRAPFASGAREAGGRFAVLEGKP